MQYILLYDFHACLHEGQMGRIFFIMASVIFSSYTLGKVNHVLPQKEIHNSYCFEISFSYFENGQVHKYRCKIVTQSW